MSRGYKFRFRLKALEKVSGYDAGEEVLMFINDIFDKQSGIAFNEIDKRFEILSADQFTGLYDKNNNPIYEGDILQGGLANNGVVTFENGTFTVWEQPLAWDIEDYDEKPEIYLPEKWAKVIGNIHQNPELISK